MSSAIKIEEMSNERLILERDRLVALIDGSENDGRTTSYGSASLDYWIDQKLDIDTELAKR